MHFFLYTLSLIIIFLVILKGFNSVMLNSRLEALYILEESMLGIMQ